MAQNEKAFIDSLCTVFNTLSNLKLEFECTAESNIVDMEGDTKNNYIYVTVNPNKPNKFYITVGSNQKVLLTFQSNNTNFSTEPHILSKSSPYAGMKRITYGNKSIVNIKSDIQNI